MSQLVQSASCCRGRFGRNAKASAPPPSERRAHHLPARCHRGHPQRPRQQGPNFPARSRPPTTSHRRACPAARAARRPHARVRALALARTPAWPSPRHVATANQHTRTALLTPALLTPALHTTALLTPALLTTAGHTDRVTCLAMSKDGSLLASGQITHMGYLAQVPRPSQLPPRITASPRCRATALPC